MNISKILRKILLEDDGNLALGINYKDQYDVIERGMKFCSPFKEVVKDRPIRALVGDDVKKFSEISSYSQVPYVSTTSDKNGFAYIYFGIQDTSVTDKKAFLAYQISVGTPKKVPEGWGGNCSEFQTRSEVNTATLNDIDRATLDQFLENNKETYFRFVDQGAQEEYEQVPYSELTYKTTGKKVLPNYTGPGFVFQRKRLSNKLSDIQSSLDDVLFRQNFTRDNTSLAGDSPEFNASFLLVDLAKDYPGLASAALSNPNLLVWPMKGTLQEPTREMCRKTIKHLYKCSKKTSITSECLTDLWKNKILSLQCDPDVGFFGKKIGFLGVGDELEDLKEDPGQFGLLNMINARERALKKGMETDQPNQSVRENINHVVSKVLNEEYKRRIYR